MNTRAIVISLAACLGLAVLVAWLLDWPLEKAVLLAPVIVAVAGATAFLFVLWGKVIREAVRGRRNGP